MPPRVDDVQVKHHLDVARALQRRDGLAHRHVFGQREDVRVHDAAGGLLGVFEQVLDLAGFLPAHQVKNRGLQLFRQVIDNGRRIVRRNQLDELGDLFRRPAGQQRGARFGTQLAERFHGEPVVALDEDGKRRYAIAVRELTENLREIGGMLLLEKIE